MSENDILTVAGKFRFYSIFTTFALNCKCVATSKYTVAPHQPTEKPGGNRGGWNTGLGVKFFMELPDSLVPEQ